MRRFSGELFAYVWLVDAVGARPVRREQARRVLDVLDDREWTVIDFEGVEYASAAFLRELLVRDRLSRSCERMVIHVPLGIRSAVACLERLDDRSPQQD